MNTARALKVFLAKKVKSQNWLAKEADLTREYICNLCNESSGKTPSIAATERICQALDITVSEFFKEAENEI